MWKVITSYGDFLCDSYYVAIQIRKLFGGHIIERIAA